MRKALLGSSLTIALVGLLACGVGSASAAGVRWDVRSVAESTAAPGGQLTYYLHVANVGDTPTDGSPVTLQVGLPSGLTFSSASSFFGWDCSTSVSGSSSATCTNSAVFSPAISPPAFPSLVLVADVANGVSGLRSTSFRVDGGASDDPATRIADPTLITPDQLGFAVDGFDGQVTDQDGNPMTQAGGHPADLVTQIDLTIGHSPRHGATWPPAPVKDIAVDLPPGLVGNPTATAGAKCTVAQLTNHQGPQEAPLCPPESQVGTLILTTNYSDGDFGLGGFEVSAGPISVYNMVAPPNVPARFGFNAAGVVVALNARVRSNGDYGLSVVSSNISGGLVILRTEFTFWGVPSDPSHTPWRQCSGQISPINGGPTCPSDAPAKPFFRLPTSCEPSPGSSVTDGLVTSVHADSWFNPGRTLADGSPDLTDPNWKSASFVSHDLPGYPSSPLDPSTPWGPNTLPTGCDRVPFDPTIDAEPNGPAVQGAPAGYRFDVSLPQPDAIDTPGESDLRTARVTLPEGVELSPSSAGGLGACSEDQVGLHSPADAACPDASKLGTATIVTPLLDNPLHGAVYLATPYENPSKSLLALYIVVNGPGFQVKLAGEIHADPSTGQLTTTFTENPQLPFSELQLQFKEGPRAALANPSACGSYRTVAHMLGWNGKEVETKSHPFAVSADGHGAPCTSSFSPSFTAGTSNPVAGAFSPFGLSFSRSDSEQQFSGLTDTFPAGASAVLKGVAECSAAQVKAAEEGTGGCPQASRIGSVTVGSGAGPDPYFLKGSVYLTGPYNNGPFGEAVVVPAVAGPFNLGNVVVRGSIRIDPHTAQPTVVSDSFPQFVGSTGIPTDIRRVDVNLDREKFTFNPTNCSELNATGTLTGNGGASENVSSRFQAADCASLAFNPGFKVSTNAKTSRTKGASLHVVVTSGSGQANIKYVHVSLPKIMPSRLTTLQKACADSVFNANPAGCPAASKVGTATAHTPLLAGPLTGPVYFVSHAGAAFPDLVAVLQGEGVTVELVGNTAIKNNVTSSTFASVPDVPVTRFDMVLPTGPYSALTALGNLCKAGKTVTVTKRVKRRVHGKVKFVKVKVHKKTAGLVMPTIIKGQNGAVIEKNTNIAVSGCAKAKGHVAKHHNGRHKKRK